MDGFIHDQANGMKHVHANASPSNEDPNNLHYKLGDKDTKEELAILEIIPCTSKAPVEKLEEKKTA